MRLFEVRSPENKQPTWIFAQDIESASVLFAARQFILDQQHYRIVIDEIRVAVGLGIMRKHLSEALDSVSEGIADYVPGVCWRSLPVDHDVEW